MQVGRRRSAVMVGMMGVLSAMAHGVGNALEIKASPEEEYHPGPSIVRRPGMYPGDLMRHRVKCGRPKRSKNLANCARKAKLKRRKD